MSAAKRTRPAAPAEDGDIEDLGERLRHSMSYHWWGEGEAGAVRASLVGWFDRSRRRLPWRAGDADPPLYAAEDQPYATWVSEVMLQQTRVETVVAYFERWMRSFPTVAALAAASPEAVNAAWAGLGYYSRARNLHKGAQHVVGSLGGRLPREAAALREIPGVGPYTAGAIASIAFEQPEPAVDGNVLRVLARVRAVRADTANTAFNKMAWRLARQLAAVPSPGDSHGALTQALMELGATVCTPKAPACGECPVQAFCNAHEQAVLGKRPFEAADAACAVCAPAPAPVAAAVTEFPAKKVRKPPKDEAYVVGVVVDAGSGATLMEQRPATGLLAGQWQFVTCASAEELRGRLSLDAAPDDCGEVVHVFSHRRHTMRVLRWTVAAAAAAAAPEGMEWMDEARKQEVGMTTGAKKVAKAAGVFPASGAKRQRKA